MQNANHNFLEMKCLEDLPISSFDTVCLEFAWLLFCMLVSLHHCLWDNSKQYFLPFCKTLPPPPFQLASLPELSEEFCSSINFLDTRAANLANFIVSHFLRIYSLIHHPGRAGPNYINPCHCSPARESQTVNLAGKICAFDPLSMKRHHFGWTWKVLCAAFSHFKRCSSKNLNEKHEEVMMTMMITRMVGI